MDPAVPPNENRPDIKEGLAAHLPSTSPTPYAAVLHETKDNGDDDDGDDEAAPAPFNSIEFDAENGRKWSAVAGANREIVKTANEDASPAPLSSLLTQNSIQRTNTSDEVSTLVSRKSAAADRAMVETADEGVPTAPSNSTLSQSSRQRTDSSHEASTLVSIREDIVNESAQLRLRSYLNQGPLSFDGRDGVGRGTDTRSRQWPAADARTCHEDDNVRVVLGTVERDSVFHVPEATLVEDKDEEVYLATPIEPTPPPEPSRPWWKQRRIQCLLGAMFLIVMALSIGISQMIDKVLFGAEPVPPISVSPSLSSPWSTTSAPLSPLASSLSPSLAPPLSSTTCPSDPVCGSMLDMWTGISYGGNGGGIAELMSGTNNLSKIPNKSERLVRLLEAPSYVGSFYGYRMKGWLFPPMTGEYEFFISSGGNGELWLSFDDHPANMEVKCFQPDYEGVGDKEFMIYAEQKSEPILLEKGRAYLYEAVVMEADGFDNLAIAWQYPGQELVIIPAWYSRTTKPGWPAICAVDSDCDDGVWCNGDETCNDDKVCQFGTPQTCSDELLCTDDICNDTTKSCENPTTDCLRSGDSCATDICIESLGGCQFTCGATWDTWTDIYGWTVGELKTGTNNLTTAPANSERLGSFLEAPKFYGEHFGGRMKGWLMPPITGNYTFWIAADDTGEFWLSTDDDPAKMARVCFVPGPVLPYSFIYHPEQRSDPINLVAGQTYYFEGLLKENTWVNHLAIAWEYPGQTIEVISANYSKIRPIITIQAESYANSFGVINENASDVDGGQSVRFKNGNWTYYPAVTIPITGTYWVSYRVAALNSGGRFKFEKAGGSVVYKIISIPATGGFQTWTTISDTVNLSAGSEMFGILATGGDWNINWFTLTPIDLP